MDALARFATALFASLAEAAPYLVVGYFLVALVREFVPPETLTRYLGGRGVAPLLRALGIGSLLPICSCGSIPVGIGLFRSGAAVGTVLALMTSAPAISPVSIVLGYSLLGPELLAVLVATVLVGSFLIGWVGNSWRALPPSVSPLAAIGGMAGSESRRNAAEGSVAARVRRATRWAYWDLGADVSLDLLIGLAVAAAILAFVPAEWITAWLGKGNLWAMLCVILISIPMYTCSVPAMLVMHSLLLSGASPGAAVAFLVAGPASNLGELNAIRGAMGNRTVAYYSASLVAVALAGGLLADSLVFRDTAFVPPAIATSSGEAGIGGVERVPAWHYPFVALLVGVMALGIMRRVGRWRNNPGPVGPSCER